MKSDFGDRLRMLRLREEWTQLELAAASGLSLVAVGALERGDRRPKLATARRLAKALGVSLDELVEDNP